MSDKLLLYIPDELVRNGYTHSILLDPFWGTKKRENMPFLQRALERCGFDSTYYGITDDPQKADFIFMPYPYWFIRKHDPDLIHRYYEYALMLRKKLLIDAIGDNMDSISLENVVVLRYASYGTHHTDKDVVIPILAEDLLENVPGKVLNIRSKNMIARVSFSGWVSLPLKKYYRTYIKNIPLLIGHRLCRPLTKFLKGVFIRKKVINILEKSRLIETNIIKRASFSGNSKTSEIDLNRARTEFINNIVDSDYVLCVRGDANQSTRFYEALSLGRIPLYLDTDTVLPLRNIIRYEDFCVFVNYNDMGRIDDILYKFHKELTDDQFIFMQKEARRIFHTYLRLDKFTKYLVHSLKEKSEIKNNDIQNQ